MKAKHERNTKGRIVSAAWKLFYDQGYQNTTIEEIIEASATSKGSFYHYFDSKDALLGSLAFLFDQKYEELQPAVDRLCSNMEKLLFLNRELFGMIENSISLELLTRLLSTQLTTKAEKHLLDRDRVYFKMLRSIFLSGQESGEFTPTLSVSEMVKIYAVAERALLYDWCLCGGEYSLREYSARMMPMFLSGIHEGTEA